MDGDEAEFQLVHEDDVVTALIGPARQEGAGRLQPRRRRDDDVARVGRARRGQGARDVVQDRLTGSRTASWKLRLPKVESPAGNLHFLRYPWIVSNEKLKATTGWEPTHDTRETFELTMRAKGLMESAPSVGRRPRLSPETRCYADPPRAFSSVGRAPLDKLEVTGSSPVAPIATNGSSGCDESRHFLENAAAARNRRAALSEGPSFRMAS